MECPQLVAIIPVFRGTITETARLPIYQRERLQLHTNKRKQSQDDRWLSIRGETLDVGVVEQRGNYTKGYFGTS